MTTPRAVRSPALRNSVPVLVALASAAFRALATDISGALPAAIDQPQINFHLRPDAASAPYIGDDVFGSAKSFNISGFLDTGASGVLISGDYSTTLQRPPNGAVGLPYQQYQAKQVYFQDIGAVGSDRFEVGANLHLSLAPYHPATDDKVAAAENQYNNQQSFTGIDLSFYNQQYPAVRPYFTPPSDIFNPQPLDGVNVIGMPVMTGKVAVMDMLPANTLQFDTMRTYLYNPGTAYKPLTHDTDPGIPNTTRTIKLSYASFDSFTHTGTLDNSGTLVPMSGATLADNQPTLAHNPFIGPNPLNPAGDTTPGIKVSFQSDPANPATLRSATGTFLFDTGSAASMISTNLAAQLAVRYRHRTDGSDDPNNPQLEVFNPANPDPNVGTVIADQFHLQVGGVGGTKNISGFFLKSLLVRTTQGNAANDNDPKHFRFLDAPVIVNDITLSPTLTLDGIFGMNLLAPSTLLGEPDPDLGVALPLGFAPGAFDFAAFDEAAGELKLRTRIPGDANRDGKVDFTDLVALAQNYGTAGTPEDYYGGGDFNGDDVVDFQDLVALAQHYGATDVLNSDQIELPFAPFDLGFGANAAGVPEPASTALLACAAAPLLFHRRRRT